jgi:hypothetical protein
MKKNIRIQNRCGIILKRSPDDVACHFDEVSVLANKKQSHKKYRKFRSIYCLLQWSNMCREEDLYVVKIIVEADSGQVSVKQLTTKLPNIQQW